MATMTAPAVRESRPTSYGNSKRDGVNVAPIERWLSATGGAALAMYGLSRRTLGGLGLAAAGGALVYRGLSGHCPCYGTLGISTAEKVGPATSVPAGKGIKVVTAITVNRPADVLYHFWRNLENLPRVMQHLECVERIDAQRSHWVASGPLGTRIKWDAEIHNEDPNRLIAWRSLAGSEVDTAGSVHFTSAPGGRGTEVKVTLKYDPPAGKAGAIIARLLGESPEEQIREDLWRFKQLMESGEVPATARAERT